MVKALCHEHLCDKSDESFMGPADLTGVSMMVVVAVALLNDRGQILLSQRKVDQSFPGAYKLCSLSLF